MSRWCSYYNCWCSDAKEITDGEGDCDYNCNNCVNKEEVSQKGRINDNYMSKILKKYSRC